MSNSAWLGLSGNQVKELVKIYLNPCEYHKYWSLDLIDCVYAPFEYLLLGL